MYLAETSSSLQGFLGGVFKPARNSIRSRSSLRDSFCTRSAGMAEGPRLRLFDRLLGHDERPSSAVISRTFLSSSPRRTPVTDLAVAGRQHDRFEPLGDLFVGVDDRLQQICAILPAPMPESSGPTSPPVTSPVGPLTLWQRRHSTAALDREDRHAALGVAAGQDFAVRGQRVALGLGLFVLLKLAAEFGRVAFGGGLDQVELELGGDLAGDQPVEPAESVCVAASPGMAARTAIAPCCSAGEPCSSRSSNRCHRRGGIDLGEHRRALGPALGPGKIKARPAASTRRGSSSWSRALRASERVLSDCRLSVASSARRGPASLMPRAAMAGTAASRTRSDDASEDRGQLGTQASAAGPARSRRNRPPEPHDRVTARRLGPIGQHLQGLDAHRRGHVRPARRPRPSRRRARPRPAGSWR